MAGTSLCGVHTPGTRVGRPNTITPEATNRILAVVRAGGRIEAAAESAGVPFDTLRSWIKRGTPARAEARDAPFRTFRKQLDQARADAENRNVAIVAQAAQTNWQAAAWLLERTWPEHWARPSQRTKTDDAAPPLAPEDPFAEVDELAARRRT